MLSMGDFVHINNIFLMKTASFNAGEGYITVLTKSNTFVKTNAYGSETHLREVPIYVKSRIVTS